MYLVLSALTKPFWFACRTALCHVEVDSSNNYKKIFLKFQFSYFILKKFDWILNIIYLVKLLKNDAHIISSLRQVYEEDGRAIEKLAQNEFRGHFAV